MTKLLVLALVLTPALALGQVVDTDSLRRVQRAAVDRQRAQTTGAAAVFLDRTRAAEQRLAAAVGLAGFAEREHLDSGAAIALDPRESPAVRARALQLVGQRVRDDTGFSRRVFGVATDTAGPLEVRREAVTQLSLATFGSFAMHAQLDGFLETLRTAARDPDMQVRRVALRALAGQGDQPALNLLRDGLLSPAAARLPASEAVALLGVKDPAPYYDLLRRVMLQPPDSATRLAALRLLGGDAASRGDLVRLLRDPQESPGVRQAALGALGAGDPRGLPQHVLPVAADDAAPLDLRIRAIKAVEISRTSRDPQVFTRVPDAFDRLMEELSARSPQAALRDAARQYLSRTREAR